MPGPDVLVEAQRIAEAQKYPTLGSVFAELVRQGLLRSKAEGRWDYVWLSRETAKLRRAGEFPMLYSANFDSPQT